MPEFALTHPNEAEASGDMWSTPAALFDVVDDAIGPFDLDPCSHPDSHTYNVITERKGIAVCLPDNGLASDLSFRRVWCNPPFSDPLPWANLVTGGLDKGTPSSWAFICNGTGLGTAWARRVSNACVLSVLLDRRPIFSGKTAPPFGCVLWCGWEPTQVSGHHAAKTLQALGPVMFRCLW